MNTSQNRKMPTKNPISINETEELFLPSTIRSRCLQIFELAKKERTNFILHLNKLNEFAEFICNVTLKNYPKLDIPFYSHWNHFHDVNINCLQEFDQCTETFSIYEKTKAKLAFIIVSLLLEAPTGLRWYYTDDKKEYPRSPGQAMACFRMFMSGAFSQEPQNPLHVHGKKLQDLSLGDLEKGYQVHEHNSLSHIEHRLEKLHHLGIVLENNPNFFGSDSSLGHLLDFFLELSSCHGGVLTATQVFKGLQNRLGSLWPGPITVGEMNLGDLYHYTPLEEKKSALIPFHKLIQWLTYSLCEPLTESGLIITKINELTVPAEYQHSALMLDSGLIELKDPTLKEIVHPIDSELVIEWRALTVTLLDEIAKLVATQLNKTTLEFPLVKVLQGGTWWAGGILRQKLRNETRGPLKVLNGNVEF